MSIENQRLVSLIEFAQQSARLRAKTASTVGQHRQFALYERDIQGLSGIRLNTEDSDGDDGAWLVVERISETRPPDVTDEILRPWIDLTRSPEVDPRLKTSVEGSILIAAGYCRSSLTEAGANHTSIPTVDPKQDVTLEEFDERTSVQGAFDSYSKGKWAVWSKEEKRRRKVIRVYAELFTLKQVLEGGIFETQLELVWGVGVARWNYSGTGLDYPIITQLVEITIDPATAAIQVRPRRADPVSEVDWYASVDNPGVAKFEEIAKQFFAASELAFSPFDRATFEPVLRAAATHLDSNGVYWPDRTSADDRSLPPADDHLRVSGTWVVFARQRTNNLFVQDLASFKALLEEQDCPLPGAIAAVVTDPPTDNSIVDLPSFRGVSDSYQGLKTHHDGPGSKLQELYFPKPFNEEQVRIVQSLEVSDGVAVQGPPGTGKTHTIANVISHYLANGRRVLVTSMKDPALVEVREKLPEEIRPLAIPLLTTEQEGLKLFEFAIQKIASEVQTIDRKATARDIQHLQETIDALHSRLAHLSSELEGWARRNLEQISLDDELILPQDAAREVVSHLHESEWIPDALGIGQDFTPQFADSDIAKLREARRVLSKDLEYLDKPLPDISEFPTSEVLVQAHHDLGQYAVLSAEIDAGKVPALVNSDEATFACVHTALIHVESLQKLDGELSQPGFEWTTSIAAKLHLREHERLFETLENLGRELTDCAKEREVFISQPVSAPAGIETDERCLHAIGNLASGKSAFGVKGLYGRNEQKNKIKRVLITGNPPKTANEWQYVLQYVNTQRRLRELAYKWNSLATELGLAALGGMTPSHGLEATKLYAVVYKVKQQVFLETTLQTHARDLLPAWIEFHRTSNRDRFSELERVLRHHVNRQRLIGVWAVKESLQRILQDRTGTIITEIRSFLKDAFGNPAVSETDMQVAWANLMAELVRINGLRPQLRIVRDATAKIEESGAPFYAGRLRQPLAGTTDSLLPDNWRRCWRLRRLATYLEAIDAKDALGTLWKARKDAETSLARAYHDIVVKRTWLKLAENASPAIRAALQAYLGAIQKIGKGTGKRAVRYRQDARMAAMQSNPAVPCWIMSHHRIAETLPAELGCFDLVIIDEASQSDLAALPALLRARKILVVGDDKQVSPEGVGLEEEKVRSLMNRFLAGQVATYRPQMSPERSMYDLFKVVFARSNVMLREHFRCVAPIIEYSKREFYNHELRPLRVPRASQRLDPPLIDVLVEDGYRKGDLNLAEVRFIVDEIKRIISDQAMADRTIGVVSLLGEKQAYAVWERLIEELGPEELRRHRIECGDARAFQGKERHIMFLTMVSAPNEVGAPLSRDTFAQRFNVAASRAQDRMYLVRSVDFEHLSSADRLRRSLITHFSTPFVQDETRVEDLRTLCESPFERELYDELTQRGYWVTPQVKVGQYRIDLVVEGNNDMRLAVECDGDRYHGSDKWIEDMDRQKVLERAGWTFWRSFASAFVRRRDSVMKELLHALTENGVQPIGGDRAPRSLHSEFRRIAAVEDLLVT
jgi:very-short-patch-repair endonuclease